MTYNTPRVTQNETLEGNETRFYLSDQHKTHQGKQRKEKIDIDDSDDHGGGGVDGTHTKMHDDDRMCCWQCRW